MLQSRAWQLQPGKVEVGMFALLITRVRTGWRKFVSELKDPYRPELHYLRGPGPKCQAKNGIKAQPAYPAHSAEP